MPVDDPIALFATLYERASSQCPEHDAMVLSTVDPDGRPSARYVLLKAFDDRGFVFYTNVESRKARALAAHPHAALTFYWPPQTQVRIEGGVERVTDAEADDYFGTRPRGSQIGAWASRQSSPLTSRAELDRHIGEIDARFAGTLVPRPPFWSGYRVLPSSIEFWTRDVSRLHERIVFHRDKGSWSRSLLFP
ncbi:MAG: pyridoxine/pyridoxamine 5-phosphate oxidase [Acidobacteria bacterium]|nr:pyridoxine/pyridoxamine 5-phosphate oxidase [Acidobacteriota bacterium]